MISIESALDKPPYSLNHAEKEKFLTEILVELTEYHRTNCLEYSKILTAFGYEKEKIYSYAQLPMLPVRLFKEYDLMSVPKEEIVKIMTSSGTTGQQVSKIYLNRETSAIQTKTLTRIVSSYLGNQRIPMVILDTKNVLKNRAMFNARGAGILGFSIFARDKIFALDEEMNLDADGLKCFLEKHKGETILLFGFTFMIWKHFYAELVRTKFYPDLSNAVMIHGGGWKTLSDQSVSSDEFKEALCRVCSIKKVYNYYGMVEQTGTIYMECEYGHLHTSIFSDVIVRRPEDFGEAKKGEPGLIEVVSILPRSYPGHILLTEDEGVILGEDDCPCGRKGKYFYVTGRAKNAEIRGCSDTYADKFRKY